jgi:hypothetical protein
MANDQCHWMQGEVFPIQGRRCPRPGARTPVPPGTWQPTLQWGHQGGNAGQQSWGQGRGWGLCGAAAAAIVLGGICQHHHWLDAGSHGLGPAPVRGIARRIEGVIRAVIASPPPQAHRRGPGRGEHLARPQCGAWHRGVRFTPTTSRGG